MSISNPNSTIESEYGLEPGSFADVKLHVVVEEPGSIVIPIPPDMSEVELTDEQLDQVAGGVAFTIVKPIVAVSVATADSSRDRRSGRRW